MQVGCSSCRSATVLGAGDCLKERRMCEGRREGVRLGREGDSEDVDVEREYVCLGVGEDCVSTLQA